MPFMYFGPYRYALVELGAGKVRLDVTLSGKHPFESSGRNPDVSVPWPTYSVAATSSTRFVFSLSADERKALAPGRYQLLFHAVDGDGHGIGNLAAAVITVRKPTPAEQHFLKAYSSYPDSPHEGKLLGPPLSMGQGLTFDRLLQGLYYGDGKVDVTKQLRADGLDLFAPELLALRYEALLKSKGARSAADARKLAAGKYPEIVWLLNEIDQKQGPIATGARVAKLLSKLRRTP